MNINLLRTRWAAVGAAVAITLGAGGLGISYATSPSTAATLVPITPCRLVDTRPAPFTVGPRTSPIGPAETFTVTAHGSTGNCTLTSAIPATATGLQLNVTALDATTPTFVTIWPTGATQPTSSNLNPVPGGGPVPNAVTTGLSIDGKFSIFNGFGSVNVFVDVVGYYTDHNHDDRYYTKGEVDGLLTQKANTLVVAEDQRSDSVALTTGNAVALSSTASTSVAANLLISAAVEVTANGGDDDNVNCNIDVDGVNGVRQSIDLADAGFSNSAVLTLTQVFPVAAGNHTVIVECNNGVGSASTLGDRSLSVLGTS